MTQCWSRGPWESQIPFYPQTIRSSQIAWLWVWIHSLETRQARQTKQSGKHSPSPLQHCRHLEIPQVLWSKTAPSCFQLMPQNLYRALLGCSCISASLREKGNSVTRDILGRDAYLFIALCHQEKKSIPFLFVFVVFPSPFYHSFQKDRGSPTYFRALGKKKIILKVFYKEKTFFFFPFWGQLD